jgi:hypothetical protein
MHRHKTQGNTVRANSLEQLAGQLSEWRRTHRPPSRIPDAIWAQAAELAAIDGVYTVARALGLNNTALKRRLNDTPATVRAPTFVELVGPMVGSVAGCIGECALEVESSRGARMRVVMKNVQPSGLASIIREFVG